MRWPVLLTLVVTVLSGCLNPARDPFFGQQTVPPPGTGENLRADYALTGTTLGPHPLALLRGALAARRCKPSSELARIRHGRFVRVAGLVRLRQRPQTASGVTFLTLEDEHDMVNVVVWRDIAEHQRRVLLESQLLAVEGRIEREQGVQHLIAQRLHNMTPLLAGLDTPSRDFR